MGKKNRVYGELDSTISIYHYDRYARPSIECLSNEIDSSGC